MSTGFEQTVGQRKEMDLLSEVSFTELSILSKSEKKMLLCIPQDVLSSHFSQAVFYKAFAIQPILCF